MTNWKRIVESHHAWAHPDNEYRLMVQPPASADDLSTLQNLFGSAITDEMRSLYEQIDGFGIELTSGEVSWFITPISKLPELFEHCRSWLRETHPELASRFFPFIDWHCGDFSGFLLSEKGTLLEGLFTFEHEVYEFKEDQDEAEFLTSDYETIEEFLTPE